jgi:hypothetical protein
MRIEGEGQMLRVFVDEQDEFEGKPLYQAIVQKARSEGLAGATVLRGMMGYGANSLIHSASTAGIEDDMPVVVEIVDSADKIKKFVPALDKMVKEGLVTLEKVNVIFYRSGKKLGAW